MSRTVRELIRVLERASSQAKMGDLTEVVASVDNVCFMIHGPGKRRDSIPGEGETAVGAHYDPDTDQVVIDTEPVL